MEGVSIVIPYHNDPDDLMMTLEHIYNKINVEPFEVIVVNDGGRKKLTGYERSNLTFIHSPVHLGVGRAFDIGVNESKYDTIFLSGSDIIQTDNQFASKMVESVKENPKSIICTACTSSNSTNTRYGADVLFKITADDLPAESKLRNIHPPHRSILEGKWREKTGEGTYELPCLMGAFYGTTKKWYNYVRGFELHYIWGSLEPYISLKTWLLGGRVLINTDIDVTHIMSREGHAFKQEYAIFYNRLMIAFIVFGNYGIPFMEHYGQSFVIQRAADMYMSQMYEMAPLRKHIEKNAVMSAEELHMKMVAMSSYHQKEGLKE